MYILYTITFIQSEIERGAARRRCVVVARGVIIVGGVAARRRTRKAGIATAARWRVRAGGMARRWAGRTATACARGAPGAAAARGAGGAHWDEGGTSPSGAPALPMTCPRRSRARRVFGGRASRSSGSISIGRRILSLRKKSSTGRAFRPLSTLVDFLHVLTTRLVSGSG